MTCKIELTRGYFAIVDLIDAERVKACNWFATGPINGPIYAARHYRKEGRHIRVYLHRFILETTLEVDHKNGNKLDCRRENLRPATHLENSRNAKIRSDNPTGFKGVLVRGKSFEARIKVKGKIIYLGRFDRAEYAALVYDHAARASFGEFARTNFGGSLCDS